MFALQGLAEACHRCWTFWLQCWTAHRTGNEQGLWLLQIDAAVRFLLPGELFKHAVAEGRKAVTRALTKSD